MVLRVMLVVGAIALAACGSGAGGHGVTVTGPQDDSPTIALPDTDPPSELVTEDLRVGEGPEVKEGTRVSVHYIGVSWATQAAFDSSWGRAPFAVEVGAGSVIEGWDQGLVGMRVGGRRLLIIPPELGYGERGAGGDIPPNDTLVFVVDAVDVAGGPS